MSTYASMVCSRVPGVCWRLNSKAVIPGGTVLRDCQSTDIFLHKDEGSDTTKVYVLMVQDEDMDLIRHMFEALS